jgi:hypothetical protein
MKLVPPAALGNIVGRLAVKQAGPFENGEPGFKHAIAGVLGVAIGSNVIGTVFRDTRASEYAYASGLGYLGELFLRKRFLADSPWYTDNISLEGDAAFDSYMDGPGTATHDLGAPGDVVEMPGGGVVQVLAGPGQGSFKTAQGNDWIQTANGWQMAGERTDAALQMPTPTLPGGALRGFQAQSALGTHVPPTELYGPSADTSFGYAAKR